MDKFSKNEVFLYLEQLKASGETNMWGAAPYLEQHFELDKKTAKEWLLKWIKSYNKGVEE
tara:strand:- start:83 stop:262 length:180 start_codon:yes stop_codon:yes gene_type:complete